MPTMSTNQSISHPEIYTIQQSLRKTLLRYFMLEFYATENAMTSCKRYSLLPVSMSRTSILKIFTAIYVTTISKE